MEEFDSLFGLVVNTKTLVGVTKMFTAQDTTLECIK